MTNVKKNKGLPLVVGPMPPPVGGIATIVAKLAEWPGFQEKLQFLDTRIRDEGRFSRLIRPLRLLIELNRSLRSRPKCVLIFCSAHASFWEKSLWLTIASWRGVPMAVMMVAGTFPAFYQELSAPLRRVVRWMLERFNTVIVQTETWKRFYRDIAPGGKYLVLPNGVDCDEFVPIERTSTGRPVVLFVGWLIREKGVFDLVEAARILQGRAKVIVRLIGPFHGNEPALRAQISAMGLENVVQLVGEVRERGAILEEYHRADVFVLPSWAEGLPVAVLEAMACGLPVVASNVGGIPDLVEHGVSGFLTAPRDPPALAAALERLVLDGDIRSRFGRAARERVESAFSNDAFIRGVLTLLEA